MISAGIMTTNQSTENLNQNQTTIFREIIYPHSLQMPSIKITVMINEGPRTATLK